MREIGFSPEMQALEEAVLGAGKIAQELLNQGAASRVKEHVPGGSHHSISTDADEKSQEHLLAELRHRFPDALFLAEEDCVGRDVITDETVRLLHRPDQVVFVIDAVDGTASAYRRRWDWSSTGSVMKGGEHVGGCVFAPEVRGGLEVVGEQGVGVFIREGEDGRLHRCHISSGRTVRESTVLLGVDVHKRPQFKDFQHYVANEVETVLSAGSTALGVATLVAGRAEALVEPYQWPWDWSTAPALIPVSGGKVRFYHYRGGTVVEMAEPDDVCYSRTNRTQGMGFVAGVPEIVDWLFEQLQEHWIMVAT